MLPTDLGADDKPQRRRRGKKQGIPDSLVAAFFVGAEAAAQYLHKHHDMIEVDEGLQRLFWLAFGLTANAEYIEKMKIWGSPGEKRLAIVTCNKTWDELDPQIRNFWRDFTRYVMICMQHPDWGKDHPYGAFAQKFIAAGSP